MYPEINLGPLTLQTFGLMFALAFLAAGALIAKRLRRDRQAGRLGLRDRASRRWSAGSSARASTSSSRTTTASRTTCSATSSPARGWSGTAALIGGALGVVALGLVPRLPRARPARPGGAGAGARLRDRPVAAASSPATATTARPGTGPGRCPTRTGPCRPRRPSTRPRSTRRWRWGSAPGSSGSCATASAPASSSRSTWSTPGPSASWSSSCAATTTVALGLTGPQLESLAMMVVGVIWILAVRRRYGTLSRVNSTATAQPRPAA